MRVRIRYDMHPLLKKVKGQARTRLYRTVVGPEIPRREIHWEGKGEDAA